MHKISLLTFIVLLTFAFHGNGQSIAGTVYDAITKQPVAHVHIHDIVSGKTTISDSSGNYSLDIKSGITTIKFSHISYETKTVKINASKDSVIQTGLISNAIEIEDISVISKPIRFVTTQSYSHICLDDLVIEEKIATTLIDILEEIPGITKRGEYFSPLALRGLGGKRLLVTKDGNRRMGNFSGGFMGQGINIYDLKKIEVIKGPASVIYGPGAISGIINMESKYPFSKPGVSGRILTSYGMNNNEINTLAGLNWASLDHALSFSCRYRTANDYVCGNGETAENSSYEDKDARLSYSWEGNNALRLTAESEFHLGGPWGRPVGFSGTDYITVTNKVDDTWHSSITVVWKPEKTVKKVECSVYYDREKRNQIKDSYDVGTARLSYREDIRYENYYGGWRELTVIGLSKQIEIKTGTDGVYYRIESPTTETDYFLTTTINNRVTKNAGVAMAGLFAESEYTSLNEKIKIRAGVRSDYSLINEGDVHDTLLDEGRHSSIFSWSGTSSIVYKTAKNICYSFQLARSCRIPDSKEMFISTSGTDGMIYGNPDLMPEHGINLDAGLRGHFAFCTFDLSLFSNFLSDFISLEYWTNSGKRGINYRYENIDKARIYGFELAYNMQWKQVFHPDNTIDYNGTAVYTIGDKLTDTPGWFSEGVPLRTIPPFNTSHECIFKRLFTSSLSMYVSGNVRYYTTQYRIAPSEDGGYISPAYCLFGAGAGIIYKRHSIKWDLKFKIDNIANNNYYAFETLVYSMGRNYKVMLVMNF